MKQTIFETRERANELLKESLEIWRQSDFADALEGIEKDPVFSLLIGALAYQENEFDNDITRLKEEITEDFARLMTPFEIGHAIPASVVVSTQPSDSLVETHVAGDTEFRLDKYSFIPLFDSKVINVSLGDCERIDGRRWKMEFNFPRPITSLNGFSFAVKDLDFRTLNVKIKGCKCQLIKPWNLTELPYSKYFRPDSLTYNHGEYFSGSMLPFDLFAQQNIRNFWIDDFEISTNEEEFTKLEFIFEFTGIKEDFIFEVNNLVLNSIFLVNASVKEVTLTSSHPIARIAGYTESNKNENSQQFLQLIHPLSDQIYSATELEVRRVSGDRFNQGNLIKLLSAIVNKYHTDFYAFRNLEEMKSDRLIFNLQELVNHMIKISQKDYLKNIAGVYLLLHEKNKMKDSSFSLTVNYLTTSGAAVNSVISSNSKIQTPGNLNNNATVQIGSPTHGFDEVSSDSISKTLLRYYILTNDRIVTPSDIKLFCIKELQRRYSIGEETIRNIKVVHRQSKENYGPGYEMYVEISLKGSSMVKKILGRKLSLLEFLLQKMIEMRSTGIYPIRVNINIDE
ncbi:MAG: hypothetical protein J1F67_06610 [Muribaculaceae bacterium]|nr:hypothetical protein [Muribaculaceae bacterium]